MKQLFVIISLLMLVLVACTQTATPMLATIASVTSTATPATTPTATSTPTPEPTSTPTPLPLVDLKGLLFFDHNGSGLREDKEPLITDFGVCTQVPEQEEMCVDTDEDGFFVFEDFAPKGTPVSLKFVDPNADNPASAFTFINLWKGPVVIQAYEMNGVQVPEQHLNDTEIKPLASILQATVGEELELGLMQGLFIIPFPLGYPGFILSYFDIDGTEHWVKNESSRNYLGETYNWTWGNPLVSTRSAGVDESTLVLPGVTGTQDFHSGIDYRLDHLTPIIAPLPGEVIRIEQNNGWNVHISHRTGDRNLATFYGHLDPRMIINLGDKVFTGQIIAFSSDTGEGNKYYGKQEQWGTPIPHLHFGITRGSYYDPGKGIDPYRNASGIASPLASEISYWTADNRPVRIEPLFDPDKIIFMDD